MMGATASFHRNDTRRQFADKLNQCLLPHRRVHIHRSFVVNPDNAAAILPYIDP